MKTEKQGVESNTNERTLKDKSKLREVKLWMALTVGQAA